MGIKSQHANAQRTHTQRIASWGWTLHVEVVALVKAPALGPVGGVAVRVLLGRVLVLTFVVRGTGAGHVDVRLRGLGIARGRPGRGFVAVHYVFYVRRRLWEQTGSK